MRLDTSRGQRGAVIPLMALLLPVLLIITAIAVDLGRQRNDRRDMQSAADVIALDMARLANGRTIDGIAVGDIENVPTETALQASADRNEIDRAKLTLQWGTTDASGAFTAMNLGTDIPDTAQITANDSTDYFFRPGDGDVERVARARYGADALAGFKVGSFGVSVDPAQAGLLNSLISPLLGNPVGLDVLSYQGLAGAEVNVFELGTELGLLTPEDVLNTDVAFDDVLLATADILERNGDSANAALLRNAITTEIQNMDVRLGDFVDAASGGEGPGMAADLNVLGLITGTALAAQCTPDPTGFDDCSGLSIPQVNANAGLLSAGGTLKVIQGPQYAYGRVNEAQARTGQVQLNLETVVGSQAVGSCVPSLGNLFCILGGLLVGAVDATVSVTADVRLAGGRNTLTDITCTDPTAESITINTNTNLYEVALTIQVTFGRRGLLGGILGPALGTLTLSGVAPPPSPPGPPVITQDAETFTVPPDTLGVTTRSTGSATIGLSGVALSSSGTGVLGTLGGLGINRTVAQITTSLVNPLLGQLDTQILGPLTQLIGANVTGSDLTPERIDCNFGNVQLVG